MTHLGDHPSNDSFRELIISNPLIIWKPTHIFNVQLANQNREFLYKEPWENHAKSNQKLKCHFYIFCDSDSIELKNLERKMEKRFVLICIDGIIVYYLYFQ